ncbi:MAG: radical SAM protein [Ghiorsea sp.]|nr:radical SAM protein [Ghiorsea sp.]
MINPFNSQDSLDFTGQFADYIFSVIAQQPLEQFKHIKPQLQMLERKHAWLKGLSTASLTPQNTSKMLIGDELGLLFLEVTDQCNEKCIHCYASSSPQCSDFLSLEEIKRILDEARNMGQPFVQFTGGDPLIHRHIIEAIAYAHQLDFQGIEVYTNGLLLHEKLLNALVEFQPIFAFSLYSPDEAVHDGITQVQGSFKKTIAAIHRTQNMGFKVRIGMAVMQQNAGHEQAMLDFANSEFCLDKTSVRFDPVHETGRGSNLNTKGISLMPSQNSHMPDAPQSSKHHQVVQTDQVKIQYGVKNESAFRKGKLAVCANGDISPCIFNREHKLGNIRRQSLSQAVADAPNQGNKTPSVERWNFCQHNLSCADCQMVAYTLGDQNA